MGIKETIRDSIEVYRSAKRPSWDEVKKMVYITLLLFAIVAVISLALFMAIQFILNL